MKIREIGPALLLTLLLPQIACAQVVITEIMYDPAGTDSGREWIEVYNASPSAIPLTKWRVFEGDANHNILASSGDTALAPGTFGVIVESAAKFRSDYPDFSGELFHSAFSLDNGGASISLKDETGTAVETASYDSSQGALGDGNSLQRPPDDSAQFSPHTPTPGAPLATSVIPEKIKQSTSSKPVQNKKSSSYSSPKDDTKSIEPVSTSSAQTASAAPPAPVDPRWLLALGALVIAAAGAIVVAKHFKKSEWDIVEETPEDV